MLGAVPAVLRDRKPIRLQQVAVLWNFGLSAFSLAGVVCCMPHLLVGPAGLLTAGLYPAVCSHAAQYGQAEVGFFVALFIYSKVAEFVDTLLLLLRKSNVILLHW